MNDRYKVGSHAKGVSKHPVSFSKPFLNPLFRLYFRSPQVWNGYEMILSWTATNLSYLWILKSICRVEVCGSRDATQDVRTLKWLLIMMLRADSWFKRWSFEHLQKEGRWQEHLDKLCHSSDGPISTLDRKETRPSWFKQISRIIIKTRGAAARINESSGHQTHSRRVFFVSIAKVVRYLVHATSSSETCQIWQRHPTVLKRLDIPWWAPGALRIYWLVIQVTMAKRYL